MSATETVPRKSLVKPIVAGSSAAAVLLIGCAVKKCIDAGFKIQMSPPPTAQRTEQFSITRLVRPQAAEAHAIAEDESQVVSTKEETGEGSPPPEFSYERKDGSMTVTVRGATFDVLEDIDAGVECTITKVDDEGVHIHATGTTTKWIAGFAVTVPLDVEVVLPQPDLSQTLDFIESREHDQFVVKVPYRLGPSPVVLTQPVHLSRQTQGQKKEKSPVKIAKLIGEAQQQQATLTVHRSPVQ